MNQMIQSSAAMTETMLGDAEVMPGLGPVPLLQRQSASESRWTRPVPTSRESASKSFRNGCQMQPPELEGTLRDTRVPPLRAPSARGHAPRTDAVLLAPL